MHWPGFIWWYSFHSSVWIQFMDESICGEGMESERLTLFLCKHFWFVVGGSQIFTGCAFSSTNIFLRLNTSTSEIVQRCDREGFFSRYLSETKSRSRISNLESRRARWLIRGFSKIACIVGSRGGDFYGRQGQWVCAWWMEHYSSSRRKKRHCSARRLILIEFIALVSHRICIWLLLLLLNPYWLKDHAFPRSTQDAKAKTASAREASTRTA